MCSMTAITITMLFAIVGGAWINDTPTSILAFSSEPNSGSGRQRGSSSSLPKPLPPSSTTVQIQNTITNIANIQKNGGIVPTLRDEVSKLGIVEGKYTEASTLKTVSGVFGLAVPIAIATRSTLVRTKKRREEVERRKKEEEEAKTAYFKPFNINDISPRLALPEVKELPVIDVPSVIKSAVDNATVGFTNKLSESNVTSGIANITTIVTKTTSRLRKKLNEVDLLKNTEQLQKLNTTTMQGIAAASTSGGLLLGLAALATRRSTGISLSSSSTNKENSSEENKTRFAPLESRSNDRSNISGSSRKTVSVSKLETKGSRETVTVPSTTPMDAVPKKTTNDIARRNSRSGIKRNNKNKPVSTTAPTATNNTSEIKVAASSTSISSFQYPVPPDQIFTRAGAFVSLALFAVGLRNTRDDRQMTEDDLEEEEAHEKENQFGTDDDEGTTSVEVAVSFVSFIFSCPSYHD